MIKFEDYTLTSKDIWKYGYEIHLTKDGKDIYLVSGEFSGHTETTGDEATYFEPSSKETEGFVDLDLESIEIFDLIQGEETKLTPSKYLLEVLEEAIIDHMIDSGDEYEYACDPDDYRED